MISLFAKSFPILLKDLSSRPKLRRVAEETAGDKYA